MTYLPNEDLGWSELAERFPTGLDLAASAREYGAFMRPRGVGSAECLLRLALIYGTTSLSLRGTATWAEAKGLAQLSDVALLGRLQGADAWLGNIVAALLSAASAKRRQGRESREDCHRCGLRNDVGSQIEIGCDFGVG